MSETSEGVPTDSEPTTNPDITSEDPGGPLKEKPVEINGKFYDSSGPPKIYQNPDGTREYRGGKVLDNDQVYTERFWQNQPKGMREAMIGNINRANDRRSMSISVDPNGISEDDRKKLSAYRVLAKELGYEVGQYTFDKNSHIASAPISKKSK